MATTHLQAGGGWHTLVDLRPVDLKTKEDSPPDYWPRTSVVAQYPEPYGYRLKLEPRADAWAHFFPDAETAKEFFAAEAESYGATLVLQAGKRTLSLRAEDLEHYKGERGRRGNKLPRGFQRVDGLRVES